MDRRQYLTAAAGLGAVGTVGLAHPANRAAAADLPPPRVPEAALDEGGWEQTDAWREPPFERRVGPVTVRGRGRSRRFENASRRERLREATLNQVDTAVAVFFATRVQVRTDLPARVDAAMTAQAVEAVARNRFEREMREEGIEAVAVGETGTLPVDTGETATLTRYTGRYPYGARTVPVVGGGQVDVDGGTVGVEGWLAVWRHGGSVFVAGGGHPAENVVQRTTTDVSEAVEVTVDVDLGFEPERDRRALLDLAAAVR